MAHKQFYVFRRKDTRKRYYYAQFTDPVTGKRLTARATGQTSKAAAENWCLEQIKNGTTQRQSNSTFAEYAEDWWIYDRCAYIQRKLKLGHRFGRNSASMHRSNLEKYILPFFGKHRLSQITPALVENFMLATAAKRADDTSLSAKTVNNIMSTLRVMLGEAERLQLIPRNPAAKSGQLAYQLAERGILSTDEVRRLFATDALDSIWKDRTHYTLNFLAASTGLRKGECLALRLPDIRDTHVFVEHSWDPIHGLKEPKTGEKRVVPLPTHTRELLRDLIETLPEPTNDDTFIFRQASQNKPLDKKTINEHLYAALEEIGVGEAERNSRNIKFHSWRHFFNTFMRGRVPDSKLRKVTGHRTETMTDNYTHFRLEDFAEVIETQETLFGDAAG